jgi:hypothetical protein
MGCLKWKGFIGRSGSCPHAVASHHASTDVPRHHRRPDPPSQSSTRLRRHHHAPRAARAKSTYGCSLPHAWPSADALAGSLPAIAASDACAPRTSCATPLIRLPCIEAEPHTTPFHPRAHMRSSSPPLPLLRGTRPSSSSRPLPTTPRSSLDLTRASTTTCWPQCSPEFEPRRPHHRGLAATARRSRLRPSHHHQSARGKLNRTSTPFVALLQPPYTTGELTATGKGTVVKPKCIFLNKGAICDYL